MNFLQNHNAKLESENILLRREIENLHCQLRLRPDIWSGPGYHDRNSLQSHVSHNPAHRMEETPSAEQKTTQQNSQRDPQPINDTAEQTVDHFKHNVASYQTPSGVIKEIDYDHRKNFQ